MINKNLRILKSEFTIYRLNADENIPEVVYGCSFYWIGKTDEELSIVCESGVIQNTKKSSGNWSIIKIVGKLDFTLVGILADITNVLKNANVSIIALSTYDTDYIMVKKNNLQKSKDALEKVGFKFEPIE